jgi:hypothetical protein
VISPEETRQVDSRRGNVCIGSRKHRHSPMGIIQGGLATNGQIRRCFEVEMSLGGFTNRRIDSRQGIVCVRSDDYQP